MVVVVVVVVVVGAPVHTVPFRVNVVGLTSPLAAPEPLKPMSMDALVPRLPFHDMLAAVTFAPDCVQFALQPCATRWLPGNANFSVQPPVTASPRLVIFTEAPNPPPPQLFAV